jgi:hypothetical protein
MESETVIYILLLVEDRSSERIERILVSALRKQIPAIKKQNPNLFSTSYSL